MKRRRNRIPSNENDRWFERYDSGGYFCLPRQMLRNVLPYIDNATFVVYVALASCHVEGNTTYPASYLADLVDKDDSAVRWRMEDLETLGLIRREPLGRGYKILFECPSRARVKEGAAQIDARKRREAEGKRLKRGQSSAQGNKDS